MIKRLVVFALLACVMSAAYAQQFIQNGLPNSISNPLNNQCLVYHSSTKSWVNGSCASGGGATITGSPVNGNLTFFSGVSTIGSGNLSGDCSTSGTDALTCTKTNGAAFSASATTDTTNATNISSGTLSLDRLNSASGTSVGTLGAVPRWVHVGNALTYSSFSTAALTNGVTLFNLPAAGVVHAIKIKHSTAFSGPSITGYTISVGISNAPTKLASAFSVSQAVSATTLQLSNQFDEENEGSATAIIATATSTGANLSAATAGVVDIWALLSVGL